MDDDKSYYEKLCDVDILYHLRGPLRRGDIWIDPEAKVGANERKFQYRRITPWEVPWIYVRNHPETRCFMWSDIMFYSFKGMIDQPAGGCLNCYKVVVRPRTLAELFKLEKLQRECDFPCKCGIEIRPIVHGNYGGYFYTRSLEEGRKRYKEVRQLVDEKIDKEVPVILKRGCTEMEIHFGDSKDWQQSDRVDWLEDLLWQYLPYEKDHKVEQLDIIQNHVHRKWIDHAYNVGDPTYKIFTNGKNLSLDYTTYHEEEKATGETDGT